VDCNDNEDERFPLQICSRLWLVRLPAARREVDDNRVRVRMKPIIYALVKYIVAMNRQRASCLGVLIMTNLKKGKNILCNKS